MNNIDKKYVILGSLCALVLMLAVGYAAFNAVLNIKGTTNISSDWDVKITGIEKIESKGATDNEGSPSYDNINGLSATFNTNFTTPGDYATYKIEITNNGSLDALLSNIKVPENTNNDIIFYLNKNQNNEDITDALKLNSTLFRKGETGNIGYVYVTVLYRDYENQQTAPTKTANMTIAFDFEQASGTVTPTPQLQAVYAYNTSQKTVGTSTLTEEEYKLDYTELVSYKAGKPMFLKYDIDEEGVIQNAYACVKHTFIDEPVCLQGGSADYYESNKAILEGLQKEFTENSVSCSFEDSSLSCSMTGFISYNNSGATANHFVAEEGSCTVGSDDVAICYEE